MYIENQTRAGVGGTSRSHRRTERHWIKLPTGGPGKFSPFCLGKKGGQMEIELTEEAKRQRQRYLDAAHAMQTGVAFTMHADPGETDPKHLRVGINTAMVEHGALVGLLIAKRLFTIEEYYKALADMMEIEVQTYAEKLPGKVTLK